MTMVFGAPFWAVTLLFCLNAFMAAAWYEYLKHEDSPTWRAALVAWSVALPLYCCRGSAIRRGWPGGGLSRLEEIQAAFLLIAFAVFTARCFKISPDRNPALKVPGEI